MMDLTIIFSICSSRVFVSRPFDSRNLRKAVKLHLLPLASSSASLFSVKLELFLLML